MRIGSPLFEEGKKLLSDKWLNLSLIPLLQGISVFMANDLPW